MGFASSPFASTPFGGLWAESAATDSEAARPTAARARVLGIDGDYELGADGQIADADDPLDEEVYFRLRTDLGSFAGDVTLGNSVARVTVSASTSPVAIRDAVLRALDTMRERGDLKSVDVSAEIVSAQGTTRVAYSVTYTKAKRRA